MKNICCGETFSDETIPHCARSWPEAKGNSEKVQPCLISEFELIDIEISPHSLCCTLFYCPLFFGTEIEIQ